MFILIFLLTFSSFYFLTDHWAYFSYIRKSAESCGCYPSTYDEAWFGKYIDQSLDFWDQQINDRKNTWKVSVPSYYPLLILILTSLANGCKIYYVVIVSLSHLFLQIISIQLSGEISITKPHILMFQVLNSRFNSSCNWSPVCYGWSFSGNLFKFRALSTIMWSG